MDFLFRFHGGRVRVVCSYRILALIRLFLCALGLVVTSVHAAEPAQCRLYKPNCTTIHSACSTTGTASQACAAWVTIRNAQFTDRTYSFVALDAPDGQGIYPSCKMQVLFNAYPGQPQEAHETLSTFMGDCPPPAACSGASADGVGDKFTTSTFPGSDGYCNAVSHCKMAVTSSVGVGGATIYKVEHTSQACANGGVPAPGEGALSAGETCAGSSPEFCMAKAGENCGYVNDSFVCLPKVGNECAVLADGGRVCGSSAPTPPVPDNGTAGVPATPDGQISSTVNNTTNVYNYFNTTTVGNSARDPGSTGENPYEDEGEDECTGEDCEPGEAGDLDSSGEWYQQPATAFSYSTALQSFVDEVSATPLVGQVGTFFNVSVSGSCPVWTTTVPTFGAITIDAQCSSMMTSLFPWIAAIVIATCAFFAFRIAFL